MRAETIAPGKETMLKERKIRQKSAAERSLIAVAVALAALLLSACAAQQPARPAVVERAEARWNAVISNELETAYEYYSPGYRSANSLIDFGVSMRVRRVQWTTFEYLDHSCEADRCTVRFNVGFRVQNPVPGLSVFDGKQIVNDTWVRTQGQWWYLPNK